MFIEIVHLTMKDMLRSEGHFIQGARDTWIDEVFLVLQGIAFALRATIGSISKQYPSQMIFNQDMLARIRCKTGWVKINKARGNQKLKFNNFENKSRIEHQYEIGDEVLIVKSRDERRRPKKLEILSERDPIK